MGVSSLYIIVLQQMHSCLLQHLFTAASTEDTTSRELIVITALPLLNSAIPNQSLHSVTLFEI